MRVLGLEITRDNQPIALGLNDLSSRALTKAAPNTALVTDVSVFSRGWHRIAESFAGSWQRNIEVTNESVLTYAAVYACVRLIATSVGKLRIKLDEETSPGIWEETTNSAYSPVLREPNHYQTRNQFLEQWMTSKLIHGNTYVLKERDKRGVVTSLYVLDPQRVRVLVAPNGDVYYNLQNDPLSGLPNGLTVPAREIIHDVMVALHHPLIGVSPISACSLAANQGLTIQHNTTRMFRRGVQPPAILTVVTPGRIDPEEIKRVENDWESHFGGPENAGRIAVIGADMKYQSLSWNSVDMQLIEQLKWTAAEVCIAFGVPAHMINVGPAPTYNNIEALNQQFYSECSQTFIEHIEALLDKGLGLADNLGTELDLAGLMRMDTASRMDAAQKAANGGGLTYNEIRKQFHGEKPVAGGDVVLAQIQNASLDFIRRRDEMGPVAPQPPAGKPAPPAAQPAKALSVLEKQQAQDHLRKRLDLAA